jgi:anti-sigma B factor antagonist
MVIQQRMVGSTIVLDLVGSLSNEAGQRLLRAAIRDLILRGQLNVLIQMERLTHLDSMGLGALIGAYGTIVHAGGRIALVKPSERTASMMTLARLLTIFEVFDSEDAAIRRATTLPAAACA